MAQGDKTYRVIVAGPAATADVTPVQLAKTLAKRYPLAADVKLALEEGRSAVIRIVHSEATARRAATLLIKLGAEVRIESDELRTPMPTPAPLDLSPSPSDDIPTQPAMTLDTPPPPPPPNSEKTDENVLTFEPPRAVSAPAATPSPIRRSALRPPQEAVADSDAETMILDEPPEEDAAAPIVDEPTIGRARTADIRTCEIHGLRYDSRVADGCSRCAHAAAGGFRIGGNLRERYRLWLASGLAVSLLIGGIGAGLYASAQKRGPLLEQRIEAESIRLGRIPAKDPRVALAKARNQIERTRTRGIAVSALIWLGLTGGLLLLWYRFV